jgi:hypothetical protein
MRSIAATQSAASALIQYAEAAGLIRENLDIVLALVGAIVLHFLPFNFGRRSAVL